MRIYRELVSGASAGAAAVITFFIWHALTEPSTVLLNCNGVVEGAGTLRAEVNRGGHNISISGFTNQYLENTEKKPNKGGLWVFKPTENKKSIQEVYLRYNHLHLIALTKENGKEQKYHYFCEEIERPIAPTS